MWRRIKEDSIDKTIDFNYQNLKTQDIYHVLKTSREINLKEDFELETNLGYMISFFSESMNCIVEIARFSGSDGNKYMNQRITHYDSQGFKKSVKTIWYKLETPQEIQSRKQKHGDYKDMFSDW